MGHTVKRAGEITKIRLMTKKGHPKFFVVGFKEPRPTKRNLFLRMQCANPSTCTRNNYFSVNEYTYVGLTRSPV